LTPPGSAADLVGGDEVSDPFRRREVQCASRTGLHRMAYLEWGSPDNRVVCPDVAGRGDSDWLRDPSEYQVPVYANDMVTLIARLDVETVDWLGTSLGGLVGMALAALPGSPVTRLVLNDVGPVLSAAALARIGSYVGKWPSLPTMEAAIAYVRSVSAPFGPHSDAEWRFLTEHVVRENPDGSLRMHYDPSLAVPIVAQPPTADVELWHVYDQIRCPTMVIRGEHSDLLTRDTAREMSARGPKARVVEIAGVGHAPTLIHDDQVQLVREFFLGA
jgi:pimeloyl-ACP methyl ester carboxylesterase